ncbi:hypothetical protein N7474_010373 [Penicillium riverlandense]|uniref:uncharacterized protein n=1 Tax=Penicillium riverlandense TaxID=1903569 RepID=UPI002546B7B9|nr:uncharacterized protein N7474_010373 [Penicillium riverlandense]KAJ5806781.1 hypothetical protein N7474_010373 [Penicillium riverlandense]
MVLLRRKSPNDRIASGTDRCDTPLLKEPGRARWRPRLLNSEDVPTWYAHNAYLRTGYRPVTPSTRLCFESLAYVHNETVNVYSHLIPAVVALLSNGLLYVYFAASFPRASWSDQLVFHIYLTTSMICFGISSTYHTLLCHSPHFAGLWARFDYVAIVFQILGSFISGIYIGFYCEPHLQKLYWLMIGILGLLTGLVVVHPRLQSKEWRILRLSTFVATGLSAFAPITHASSLFPYEQLDQQAGLRYYYLEGLVLIIGVLFYATNFPESWKPEYFDIWGASHQIFHVLVFMAAVLHFYGILVAFQWNYENQRCGPV